MYRSSPAKPAMNALTSSRSCMRQRGQLQRRDPALGALGQRRDVRRGQREAHRPVEVVRRLLRGEAQVGGADLDQLAARAEPGQRQRRVGAGGDHQVQLRRQVVQQERHPVVDLRRVDDVVVVQDEDDVARAGPPGRSAAWSAPPRSAAGDACSSGEGAGADAVDRRACSAVTT